MFLTGVGGDLCTDRGFHWTVAWPLLVHNHWKLAQSFEVLVCVRHEEPGSIGISIAVSWSVQSTLTVAFR